MLSQTFFFFYGYSVFHCVNVLQHFCRSSTDGYLGCFQILVIVNNAAMNIGVQIFFLFGVLGEGEGISHRTYVHNP